MRKLFPLLLILSLLFSSCSDGGKDSYTLTLSVTGADSEGSWQVRVTALDYDSSLAEIQETSGGWSDVNCSDGRIVVKGLSSGVYFVEVMCADSSGNTYYGIALALLNGSGAAVEISFDTGDGETDDTAGSSGNTVEEEDSSSGSTENSEDSGSSGSTDDSEDSADSTKMIWITIIYSYKNMSIARVGTADKWTLTLTNADSESTKTWKVNNELVTEDDGYTGSLTGVICSITSDITMTLELGSDFSDNNLTYLRIDCKETGSVTASHYLELGI